MIKFIPQWFSVATLFRLHPRSKVGTSSEHVILMISAFTAFELHGSRHRIVIDFTCLRVDSRVLP